MGNVNMSDGDKLMAQAQIALTFFFLTFVFVVTIIYELGYTHFNDAQDKNFSSWMNWLQGAALILIYFWFQRTRTAGVPDATSQVVTQTHTATDGSSTTITTPAANTRVLPPPPGASLNAPPKVVTTPTPGNVTSGVPGTRVSS
jgi:hypothetical protein